MNAAPLETPSSEENEEYSLFAVHNTKDSTKPLVVSMTLNDKEIPMEIDTGSAVTVLPESTYRSISTEPLQESSIKLCTYSGEQLEVKDTAMCKVKYDDKIYRLPVIVLAGDGPILLGRSWLYHIPLQWTKLFYSVLNISQPIANLLQKYHEVFSDKIGTYTGGKVNIQIDPTVMPKFCKPRPLPFAIKDKVEDELKKLQEQGVIEPVKFSKWAAPIVPVLKHDRKSIRICGDYKLTANKAAQVDQYPIPKIDELLSTLAGGITFTHLDMSQAYQQLELDDQSKEIVTINTHKGLFTYHRLPFGVSSAPGIFQRIIESVLQGIPHVLVYLDDILVTGQNTEEHLKNLEEVLSRLQQAGLRLKSSKCVFMSPSVEYLGYHIDKDGLHPSEKKVKAVKDAPTPRNITEFKAYLGLLTYYGKFLPILATTLAPLYSLLHKDATWCWNSQHKEAFIHSKHLLTSETLLVHYDSTKELVLSCDASQYGIGAVLSQVYDKLEKPVAYVSRSLSSAEKNYSQLEKEGLAIVFGIKKFHNYLFGRRFTLCTDHKPLQSLLNESKAIPTIASARIQRWALTLSMYEYTIKFKSGAANGNADALSRLPLPDTPAETPIPSELVLLLEHLSTGPLTAVQIKTMTRKDPILSRVYMHILHGWPPATDDHTLQPYSLKQKELSIMDGCVLWGNRVVIPTAGRQQILEELHESHQGVSRMKGRARMVVWWPNLDRDIEQLVSNCTACQSSRSLPPVAPLHPWSWPDRPWSRLHIDYAGPISNHMLLVVVDSFSKWIEVLPVKTASASITIEKLRTLFATHGIPETIVSDNGTPFVNALMEQFLKANGVRHVTAAPYHPSSNGLAERAVQTCKAALKKMSADTLETKIQRFLLNYRTTLQGTTGIPPAQLLMGRQLRTRLDFVVPDVSKRVQDAQTTQKDHHDLHCKERQFSKGDQVMARNYAGTPKWLPGKVTAVTGPVSYQVTLADGRLWRRHQDQLIKATLMTDVQGQPDTDFDFDISDTTSDSTTSTSQMMDKNVPESSCRRSSRVRRPPDRLTF